MLSEEAGTGKVAFAQAALAATLYARMSAAGGKSTPVTDTESTDQIASMGSPATVSDPHLLKGAIWHNVPGTIGEAQIVNKCWLPSVRPAGSGICGCETRQRKDHGKG